MDNLTYKVTEYATYIDPEVDKCNEQTVIISDIESLCYPLNSYSNELYESLLAAVIDDLRKNNYHFCGSYHQNGEYGVPVINNKYHLQVTQREWGYIMSEAYPNEYYGTLDKYDKMNGYEVGTTRYLKWSFTTPLNEQAIYPNE